MVAAAVVGAGVIGAVGSNIAAGQQSSADNSATQTQQNMFNTVQGNSQPFMQAGYGATSSLSQLMGQSGTPGSQVGNTGLTNGYLTSTFNPTQQQLEQYPGYQFAQQQGAQATRNADTPGVGALSGAALKDLTNFDVGAASTYYNQDFNQYQTQQSNIYNRLSNLAGLGQSAAAGVGNSGTQLGIGAAQSTAAAGAATAGGTVGATNSLSGTGNTLGGLMYLNAQSGNSNFAATTPSGSAQGGYASGITQSPGGS